MLVTQQLKCLQQRLCYLYDRGTQGQHLVLRSICYLWLLSLLHFDSDDCAQ